MEWVPVVTGAIVAIATVVLVLITRKYVLLMSEYVSLTQQILEVSYKPEVVVSLLRSSKQHLYKEYLEVPGIILSIKNVGSGIARKINFEWDISFAPYGGEPLGSINFLKNGIDCLAPGEERRSNSPFIADPSGDLNQLQVTIKGTWEDSKGKKYCADFDLNFADPDLPPAHDAQE